MESLKEKEKEIRKMFPEKFLKPNQKCRRKLMSRFKKKKGSEHCVYQQLLFQIRFHAVVLLHGNYCNERNHIVCRKHSSSSSEIKKIEDKSLCSYIYVGAPVTSMKHKFGSEPRIQLNDLLNLHLTFKNLLQQKENLLQRKKSSANYLYKSRYRC